MPHNVCVCITKSDERGQQIVFNLCHGIKSAGDKLYLVKSIRNYPKNLKDFSAFIHVCEYNSNGRNDLRKKLFDDGNAGLINRLVIDTGFIKNKRINQKLETRKRRRLFIKNTNLFGIPKDTYYVAIGYNGIKTGAQYFNENSPSDRFDSLNVQLQTRQKPGSYILVLGQSENGVSVSDICTKDWYLDVYNQIKKYSDKPVFLRLHPNQRYIPEYYDNIIDYSTAIEDNLSDASCCISYSTNAAVDAVIAGVPLIVLSKYNITYDISEHSISNINNPYIPDHLTKKQWFNNLAYAQWGIHELYSGEAWKWWRNKLIKNGKI